MAEDFPYDGSREAYVFTLEGDLAQYRAVVSREFIEDELGDDAPEAERQAWLHANLPHILGAVTARVTGGYAKEPWSRVMVEEIP